MPRAWSARGLTYLRFRNDLVLWGRAGGASHSPACHFSRRHGQLRQEFSGTLFSCMQTLVSNTQAHFIDLEDGTERLLPPLGVIGVSGIHLGGCAPLSQARCRRVVTSWGNCLVPGLAGALSA